MKEFSKIYCKREKGIFHDEKAFSIPLIFSNCENYIGEIPYTSVLSFAPTKRMFTSEASRNRKYQIKQ